MLFEGVWSCTNEQHWSLILDYVVYLIPYCSAGGGGGTSGSGGSHHLEGLQIVLLNLLISLSGCKTSAYSYGLIEWKWQARCYFHGFCRLLLLDDVTLPWVAASTNIFGARSRLQKIQVGLRIYRLLNMSWLCHKRSVSKLCVEGVILMPSFWDLSFVIKHLVDDVLVVIFVCLRTSRG